LQFIAKDLIVTAISPTLWFGTKQFTSAATVIAFNEKVDAGE